MSVRLNHTIVWCKDQQVAATFLADTLGLAAPTRFGPFLVVTAANDVSLDFHETDGVVASQHYAFLVTEDDFDEIFGPMTAGGLDYWADPGQSRSQEIVTVQVPPGSQTCPSNSWRRPSRTSWRCFFMVET